MTEFSTKIGRFRNLLDLSFEDFLKKIPLFSFSLLLISLMGIGFLYLIYPQLKVQPFLLFLAGILVYFFSIWQFLAIITIKEEIGKATLASCLFKSLTAVFRIFLPLILIGGISIGFLILVPKIFVFFIVFLVYCLILFSSYISLTEKRKGLEAIIRSFHILRRNLFHFYWKIIIFFVILILALFVFGTFFSLFYFQLLPLPTILNFILAIIFGLIIYFFFWMLVGSYFAVLFKNTWEIKKYIAFYDLSPLLIMAVYVFLSIILAVLIIGVGITL